MEKLLRLEKVKQRDLKKEIEQYLGPVAQFPGELLFPGTDCRVLAFTLREKETGNCSGLLAVGSDHGNWVIYLI